MPTLKTSGGRDVRVPIEAAAFPGPETPVGPKWHHWIAEPRLISALAALAHAIAVVAGVAAILIDNAYYESSGYVTADAWGTMLVAGGILGVAGALPGIWWLERPGIFLEACGILAWAVAAYAFHHDALDVVTYRVALGAWVETGLASRYVRISGAYLDPRRIKRRPSRP